MPDAFVQLVSIQPSQSTKANNPQAGGGKAVRHNTNSTMKGGLYSDRRKKACQPGK